MPEQGVERRLAAILAADVAGYTRLMEADEQATLEAWWSARKEVIDPRIAEHGGRIVKHTGDGFLAEFSTVLDAVACAVTIQTELGKRNAGVPTERRMDFRMGVNLGDITVDEEDIYGDGVNIAARLEALAEPGGICISGAVHDQVHKRVGLAIEDMGAQTVKHLSTPVRVYRVLLGKRAETAPALEAPSSSRRWAAVVGVLVLLAGAGGVAWWQFTRPDVEPASIESMAFPLPDKPSIAVLPFDNLSRDANQDHLGDGITENIIMALSQASNLFVIARNSSFTYKGKPVKVQKVAADLGVRFVLEGSIQKSGDKVRIHAQLIDALSGNHLWGERYDRKMTDLFDLQDEITEHIVTALQIKLTDGEQMRVHRKHTRNLEAWNLLARGIEHFYRRDKTGNARARQLFNEAIKADRGYALAWALLAWTHWFDAQYGWSDHPALSFERAAFLAEKARAVDDELPDVHALRGAIHLYQRRHEAAVASGEKAVALSPNHATITALLALFLHNAGRPKEGIRKMKRAMRLSPYYPAWFLEELGFAYLDAEQPGEALAAFAKFLEREPSGKHAAHAHLGRARAYHTLGQDDAARAAVTEAVDADSTITVTHMRRSSLNRNKEASESGLAVLRRLGLPD
ncbi:MAG: adenylate/guanylate cyclase domain-containing protein [Rhodospirillales bacterium]|jgi:adenylate cyclase|nr:adenylate/guanylate cyclase domain-containing protein [Rhodospirillales bacterium]MDP6773089.1 adenylate/guanylate cyclase domain-containing protein [Rhodospirillales bacterium]